LRGVLQVIGRWINASAVPQGLLKEIPKSTNSKPKARQRTQKYNSTQTPNALKL
jgi:hypothetical protein